MSDIYRREMTITHKDFLRLLPKALNGFSFHTIDDHIVATEDNKTIKIRLSAEKSRQLGVFTLPITDVSVELQNFTAEDADKFMSRFTLAYQKGGG